MQLRNAGAMKTMKELENDLHRDFALWFQKWQQDFPCPKCGGLSIDLGKIERIKEPLICMKCKTHFELKAVRRKK